MWEYGNKVHLFTLIVTTLGKEVKSTGALHIKGEKVRHDLFPLSYYKMSLPNPLSSLSSTSLISPAIASITLTVTLFPNCL